MTGWEITLDLISKLASLQGVDPGPAPDQWFTAKFSRQPNYSELLSEIAKSPAERQRLLSSCFEPNDEEREQGLKQPTEAHRSIARLVRSGHIRILLTTNFDRLLERAIQNEGIAPSVISTADLALGTLPLAHHQCCIIKLHGDYLDTRIMNTSAELERYEPPIENLLDRVLEEFGVVVCGWSGQWDTALRSAIARCPSRRFTWYWTTRTKLSLEAKALAEQRSAQFINISDADSLFKRLADYVHSLRDSSRTHPASIEATIALQKRYLADSRNDIALDDLIHEETEQVRSRLDQFNARILHDRGYEDVEVCMQTYYEIVEKLVAILVTGSALGRREHNRLWIASIERLAQPPPADSNRSLAEAVRFYPIAVLLYGTGLAAVARERWELLCDVFSKPKVWEHREVFPLVMVYRWYDTDQWIKHSEAHSRLHSPLSEHLFERMRDPLRRIMPDDKFYEDHFDYLEVVRSLIYADFYNRSKFGNGKWSAPIGRFGWKLQDGGGCVAVNRISDEAKIQGLDWPILKHGLFNGSLDRFNEVYAGVSGAVQRLNLW